MQLCFPDWFGRHPAQKLAVVLLLPMLLVQMSLSLPVLAADDNLDDLDLPAPVTATASHDRPPGGPASRRWYGWQVLLVDGLAIIQYLPTPSDDGFDALGRGLVGFGIYTFGPALVHSFGHDKGGTALASIGLRVGLLAGGAALGWKLGDVWCADRTSARSRRSCGDTGKGTGALAGYVTAVALDAAWLAWEDQPIGGASPRTVRLSPVVSPAADGGFIGFSGRF